MQVRILPRAPFWPASIKVMQRTFNPLNWERYPGGPPSSDWSDGVVDCWSVAGIWRWVCAHQSNTLPLHYPISRRAGSSNSRTSPFEGERGGASPSPAANFRSVVKQDHIWPTPRNRRGSTFPSDQPSPVGCGTAGRLPRGVIRSASVSETEGPGAKPGEAANSQSTAISTRNKHLRTL